jgi:RNA-directed DNA polymerase
LPESQLDLRNTAVLDQEQVSLLGYPNHHVSKPTRHERGSVVRTFVRSAVKMIEITTKIIEGNSGGPIVDSNYDLIAIAKKGINSNTDLSSAEF